MTLRLNTATGDDGYHNTATLILVHIGELLTLFQHFVMRASTGVSVRRADGTSIRCSLKRVDNIEFRFQSVLKGLSFLEL